MKLTGKQGPTTIGALLANDGAHKAALRVKRDVGRDSTVGATLTTIREDEGFSHLLSADARVRMGDRTVITAQIAGTFAEMPFRDVVSGGLRHRRGNGLAYYGKLERRTRHTLVTATSTGLSRDYRAGMGFTRRVNHNSFALQTAYNSEPRPDARLISWTATHITFARWDWQGRADFIYVSPQVQLNFRVEGRHGTRICRRSLPRYT